MGIFSKKPKNVDSEGINPVVDEAAVERQRLKNIAKMKKKFNITVWENVHEVMMNSIPKFTMTESNEDGEIITKYVCLGFDTTVVGDFANKADDDIGSIMTAIKSSMDCVIENALFDNEIIVIIPTDKSIKALAEFEETFDLSFYLITCTDDHGISIETYADSEEPIKFDFGMVMTKVNEDIDVKKWVDDLSVKDEEAYGLDGHYEYDDDDDDDVSEDDESDEDVPEDDDDDAYDEDIPDDDDEDEEVPDDDEDEYSANEADPVVNDKHTKEEVAAVTDNAAKSASTVSNSLAETKTEVTNSVAPQNASQAPQNVTPAPQNAPQAPQNAPQSSVNEKIDNLKGAVQKASDEASQNPEIANATAAINLQNRQTAFDMQAMDTYINRKFYSDDLGLEVSAQPFDAMFMQSNPYVPFVEIENDSWLNGYVNNLRRDANARLSKLHQKNLLIMRERYLIIISKHCENIVKAVSTDDPKGRFGYALKTITDLKNNSLSTLSQTAESYKREKENEYQERMRLEMDNAAKIAKANFINRNAKEHERELREIENDLKNNIEAEFVGNFDNLQKERRNEAKRQLDKGISEALQICADEYTKMLALERKEYVRLQAVITDFENENMATEETRINNIAEEQRRTNAVDNVQREYDSKYAVATKEFEAKLAAVHAEIERVNMDHQNYIQEIRAQHEKDLQELRNHNSQQLSVKDREIDTLSEQLDKANNQIELMTKKYVELDQSVGEKYKNQIESLKSDRDMWTDRAESFEKMHKHTDALKLTGMIIGIVAALCVGIIFGTFLTSMHNSHKSESSTTTPVVNFYEKDGDTEDDSAVEKNTKDEADKDSTDEASTENATDDETDDNAENGEK